jgi:hypothetical protein
VLVLDLALECLALGDLGNGARPSGISKYNVGDREAFELEHEDEHEHEWSYDRTVPTGRGSPPACDSTPGLQYSITPLPRIRGRRQGRERERSRLRSRFPENGPDIGYYPLNIGELLVTVQEF